MENLNIAEAEQLIAEKTALVVIDLQKGIVNSPLQAPRTGEQVVQNAAKLAQAFTAKGAFVVLVKVSSVDGKDMLKPKTDMERGAIQFSADWDQFVPEMTAHTPYHTVAKRQWGAFFGTDLDLQLRRRGINTIVLCGVSTSIGVDTTAREAYQHGYQQIFVEDAMTAATKEEHDYVCNTIFPRLGRIRSSEQVVTALK